MHSDIELDQSVRTPSETAPESALVDEARLEEARLEAAELQENPPEGDPLEESVTAAVLAEAEEADVEEADVEEADVEEAEAEEADVEEEAIHEPEDEEPVASEVSEAIVPAIRSALTKRGFAHFTPVQEAVLATKHDRRDLQIASQTGSGKTVALGILMADELVALPPAESEKGARGARPTALVIAPTRELAAQVAAELEWLYAEIPNTKILVVTGGTSVREEQRQLARKPRIVVGTPGRLLDHIGSGSLDSSAVMQLVLDEADQMLDMGFRDELEGILSAMPAERSTHLVSATFPPAIRRLAETYQKNPVLVEGTALGAANEDIEHVAHLVNEDDRYRGLVNLLLLSTPQRTLVFVSTRAETTELSEALGRDGFSVMPLSGELQQAQRVRTLNAFRSGRVTVLIATDVAARGLDIPDVATVIHAGRPHDGEAYIHRSGRTGRAGNKGRSLFLIPARGERFARRILNEARVDVRWAEIPTAKTIKKKLDKRMRRSIEKLMDGEEALHESKLTMARKLLADREPEQVVAALLSHERTTLAREPFEIQAPNQRGATRWEDQGRKQSSYAASRRPGGQSSFGNGGGQNRGNFQGNQGKQSTYSKPARPNRPLPGGRSDDNQGSYAKPTRPNRPLPGSQGDYSSQGNHGSKGNFELFRVNWGFKSGANPKRLMATICRRGDVTSRVVGAIRVQDDQATFEIASNAAQRFESRAGRPDDRDPHMRIERMGSHGGGKYGR